MKPVSGPLTYFQSYFDLLSILFLLIFLPKIQYNTIKTRPQVHVNGFQIELR